MTGKHRFTHVADHQAEVALGNALFPLRRKVDHRVAPWTASPIQRSRESG